MFGALTASRCVLSLGCFSRLYLPHGSVSWTLAACLAHCPICDLYWCSQEYRCTHQSVFSPPNIVWRICMMLSRPLSADTFQKVFLARTVQGIWFKISREVFVFVINNKTSQVLECAMKTCRRYLNCTRVPTTPTRWQGYIGSRLSTTEGQLMENALEIKSEWTGSTLTDKVNNAIW